MILVAALDDVRAKQTRRDTSTDGGGGGVVNTPFIGSKHAVGLPHAQLNSMDSGRYSNPHYHVNDQFQVVVSGRGTLGRHKLKPCTIHFSRAYTPYGPLVSVENLAFFVLRAHPDPGGQHLPAKLDALKGVANRQPWQTTANVSFDQLETEIDGSGVLLKRIPEIRDDQGLAAYALCMQPDASVRAPDVSGDGQYIVVFKGSAWHLDREYSGPALVFVDATERALPIRSGSNGLRALVLNFPQPRHPVSNG